LPEIRYFLLSIGGDRSALIIDRRPPPAQCPGKLPAFIPRCSTCGRKRSFLFRR
jgi:hypothetical protein